MSIVKGRPELEKLMQESDRLIMVKFVAPHCSCNALAPLLHQIAIEQENNLDLIEIDMTEEPEFAINYESAHYAHSNFFKNQQMLVHLPGVKPKKTYQEMVRQHL
ncbi:MAG: thioredoxin domain-containing protein [Gloeobacterales cyanobacterium]